MLWGERGLCDQIEQSQILAPLLSCEFWASDLDFGVPVFSSGKWEYEFHSSQGQLA